MDYQQKQKCNWWSSESSDRFGQPHFDFTSFSFKIGFIFLFKWFLVVFFIIIVWLLFVFRLVWLFFILWFISQNIVMTYSWLNSDSSWSFIICRTVWFHEFFFQNSNKVTLEFTYLIKFGWPFRLVTIEISLLNTNKVKHFLHDFPQLRICLFFYLSMAVLTLVAMT